MDDQQKAAALHLSVCLGNLDALLQLEPPKSAKANRLAGAINQVARCVDLYRLQSFSTEDMANAGEIIDMVNDKIVELYP